MKSQPTRRNELFGNLRRRLSKWLPAVLCCVLLSGGWWGLRTTHATATSAAALACTTNPVVMNGNDSGAGSLRQAIIDACPGSTITFSVSGTITLASTLPPINNDLTIDGTGRSIIVSGNNSVQVMIVNSGKALTLLNLTIANGKCGCRGGGIVNFGTLTVTNSTFSGNSVGNGDGGADGGGIENDGGTVNVTNSTFTGNSAYGGGGIENRAGTLNVINSTFSDNSARLGGGIYNRSTANVTNSTFSGNSLADLNFTGGGILNDSTLNFANTIIANSSRGVDCANLGTIGTNKNNLVMDGSCSPALSGDPKLGPLQNNGGPTQTMALLPGSPAIDLGDNCVVQNPGCLSTPLTTDQRGAGFPRKVGSVVDIGAFEVGSCVTNPIVTTTADSGAGSLRQAIADACPGSAITFNLPANSTITLTSGELVLDKNLTIQGPGANLLTISGNNASRVFDIPTDVTATLSGLTITNGNAVGSGGGGICNQGTLTVRECLVSNSSADNHGGGILNTNLLTVVNSTIANNQDTADIGGIDSHGTATISNSTITGNSGSGIAGESGAILLTVTNCTITNNAAGGFGGGIFKNSGIGNIKGTIVAGNTAGLGDPDAFGSYVSQGFNLIGQNDSSTGFTNGVNNDQVGTSANPLPALLAPLGNYGGPTQTHALLPGSPAINAGTSSGAPATDQRGINRVGNVDIGAFESRGFMLAIMSGNNQTAAPTAPFANPLAVAVSSNFNEPVQGGQVSFTPPGSGPSAVLSNSAVTLPANGQASVMATANALSGAYQVTAGGAGMNQVAFALNNFCVSNPVVTNLNDSGPGSLRQAIADACVGSTITFNLPANSTITLTSGELVINKHLTIQGPGANLLTVSGNNQSRVFQIVEAPLNVTLSGLTIAAGYHKTPDVVSAASFVAAERAYGGGLYDQSSGTVNLTDCVLTGNRTQGGNATGSNSESVVSGEGFGGAIAQRGNGVLNINGCRFTNNYAFTGTASGGSNNFAFPSQGGAINCDGTLNLSQCTLSGNSALRGGAIYQTGSMTLAASSIYNNEARDSGGGVDDEGTASTIINTTISGNRAVFDGGGIRSRSRNRTITNCTITDNHVDGQLGFGGGGLFGNINPPLQLKNTIIAGNTAPASPDLQDLVTSLGNNLIGDGTGANGLTNGVNGDQVGTPAAPLDAKLGPLANNGGPTLTHRLLPGSPAINAGTSSDAPATDQRGVARPQNGALDIGAVESNYVLAATSGTPQTTIPGTPFAAPLLATLTENGLPLANVPLTFSAPGSGASATFPGGATVNTNAQGQASASAVANLVPGSYAVQAAATGLPPASFALTNACPTITLAALPQATAGVLFNAALSASPAGGNYQFSSANLPGWLTLGGNGSLSGTPPAAGTFTFNVSVTGFGQCQQNFSVRLTVVCPAITLTPVNLPAATINTAYPTTLSASPAGAFSFALTGGLLPAGLTLNSNGTFSGAPTQSGVFNFRV
ncbi:MAG: right-handed parallel beta-helix repeat-containing protein, partial [Acidobacteria bacterium]|nr:right-handed parallel beta-helix repeat-containing protein [Acidobacteriota bacterium]